MTLSAFGMGALLAVGTASAQQIPAPDAYGDPQACATSVAKLVKDAAAAAAVAAAADTGGVGDNGLTATELANLRGKAQACAPEGGDTIGGGIGMARTLYQTAAGAAAGKAAAEKVYEGDDSAGNKEKLDEATTAHDMAVADRNAYSGGGSIYEAVYAEEEKRDAATAASEAYTKAAATAETAETTRDMVEYKNYINNFAGFDENGAALEFEFYKVETTPDVADTEDDESRYTVYLRVKKQGGAAIEGGRGRGCGWGGQYLRASRHTQT